MQNDRNTARTAFLTLAGWGDAARTLLAGDASFRTYDRLAGPRGRAVLMDAPPPQEDVRPFVRVARHLTALGYSAPSILAEDPAHGFLLLEDLGDTTFTRCLAEGADEPGLYTLAVDLLTHLHGQPTDTVLPPDLVPPYDDTRLLAEARLLTDWYMPAVLGGAPDAAALDDYEARWRAVFPVARAVPDTLVLRDFHVDNLLVLDDRTGVARCGLLDFQDAVAGPVTYDLVSLLEDARRDIDPDLVAAMRARYHGARPDLDLAAFDASWAVLAAQRHAKVIGVFTRLARRDGKPHYLPHIARVWRLLDAALAHPALAEVRAWIDDHIPPERRLIPT
ncbi:aminoglycoside phosphotransferase family protein [Roseospira navarrensis]|uniref:Phosphotransferase n=1 Tax=Roseospira navarrensis TaxID=140058 RepID=A0A7X2D5C1_9PROT|nr:phosphotransferase [Roseospira navarrensis]MQX37537.1 phosphotransferase [Roseospira navarrensis]